MPYGVQPRKKTLQYATPSQWRNHALPPRVHYIHSLAMETKEAFRLALQSLWANKLRTVLTLLGVVIGVASVIAVVTLVNGANAFVASKFTNYGADVFTVSKQASIITSYEDYLRYQKRKNITLDDFHYVQENCHSCGPMGALQGTLGKIVHSTQSITDSSIRGYTWQMPDLQNLNITVGRGFTDSDDQHGAKVAIVGTDIQENLFAGTDPIGGEVRVDGVPYTIIGVSEKQGKTFGRSQDNWVAIPLNSYQKTYGTQKTVTLYIKGGSATQMEAAQDETRVLMRNDRHDRPGEPDSFNIDTNDTFLSMWKSISAGFEGVAVAIAGISLVVGGIVIMNIMLVSVTERTREIGIRKALGARRGDILMQFLMESAIMALIGGVVGVAGGVIVAQIATLLSGFPSSVALWSIFMGLFVATSTGIFFGVYPARKAAELDPIVALRSE